MCTVCRKGTYEPGDVYECEVTPDFFHEYDISLIHEFSNPCVVKN